MFKPGKLRGYSRLDFLYQETRRILRDSGATDVFMEDYAYSRTGAKGRIFSIGEGGGVAKLAARQAQSTLYSISSTSLKKSIIGRASIPKGNEGKDVMKRVVESLIGHAVDGYDEADATALLLYGEAHLMGRGKPTVVSRVRATPPAEVEKPM